ncbi:Ferredoxin-dependent glutamate synthase 1 [bioreactor metagenome]|uniref:Ferredoxin-dependent glutamate synthase 1 n=1 Tax=bioreactor metagenome TaxID=1076179 RepID=A0A645BDE0_9ZZZZ
MAEEVRGYLARLGLRSLDEAVGRTDLLRTNRAIDFFKARHLDFSRILAGAGNGIQRFDPAAGPLGTSENYDEQQLLPALADALDNGKAVQLSRRIANSDRAAGTRLAGEIARRHGAAGLPEGTIRVDFTGCAGQSFGAFLAPGVTFTLEGEANDFVGKGLSGGTIVIRVPRTAGYSAAGNVIAGNVIGYGATAGAIFLNGQAGERFAVRNSGATLVVEGVGDHGCEYMTGGRVVVLGRAGINFAAGMTGGLAYVLDEAGDFDLYCNPDSVDLEPVVRGSADERELLGLLERHRALTGSVRAEAVLADWENVRGKFVKVFPVEYRHALAVAAERAAGK